MRCLVSISLKQRASLKDKSGRAIASWRSGTILIETQTIPALETSSNVPNSLVKSYSIQHLGRSSTSWRELERRTEHARLRVTDRGVTSCKICRQGRKSMLRRYDKLGAATIRLSNKPRNDLEQPLRVN